jgi:hypothetical protein
VVSADALFTLTDLSRPDAVDSAVHTARALTDAALREAEYPSSRQEHRRQHASPQES